MYDVDQSALAGALFTKDIHLQLRADFTPSNGMIENDSKDECLIIIQS